MPEQQQESLKVYELAKELGLDSFTLLDKLKQINIEVKSHMSSLEESQAEKIREALRNEGKARPTTIVKKKATVPSSITPTISVTAGATTTKKVTKKSSTTATTPKPSTDVEEIKSAAEAPKKKVIKRRCGNTKI